MRLTASLSIFAFGLASACSLPIQEADGTSTEGGSALREGADYQTSMDREVEPFCQAQGKFGTFAGVDGVKLAYGIFEQSEERGAIVLIPGRTETFMKYCELVYQLRGTGYSVYAMDIRGQGLSGRINSDSMKGDVKNFEDYVTDIETFTTKIVKSKPHAKTFLLAHSMGGGASTLLLEKRSDLFDAAVLSSPMQKIVTAPYPEAVAYGVASAATLAGKGEDYVMGRGPYDPKETFESNVVTHSRSRWVMNQTMWREQSGIRLGGPTNRWIQQSIQATWKMRWNASALKTPVLLMQAGADKVVDNKGQDEICSKAPNCTKVIFAGGYHELLQESDPIRDEAVATALAFFASH